jgi:hypothetical protein
MEMFGYMSSPRVPLGVVMQHNTEIRKLAKAILAVRHVLSLKFPLFIATVFTRSLIRLIPWKCNERGLHTRIPTTVLAIHPLLLGLTRMKMTLIAHRCISINLKSDLTNLIERKWRARTCWTLSSCGRSKGGLNKLPRLVFGISVGIMACLLVWVRQVLQFVLHHAHFFVVVHRHQERARARPANHVVALSLLSADTRYQG